MKLFKSHGRMKEALSAPQLSAVSEETAEAARTRGPLVRRDLSDSEDEDRSGDLLAMGMPPFKEGAGEGEGGGEQPEEEQEVRHDEIYSHLMVS